jgi:hypothetical protein
MADRDSGLRYRVRRAARQIGEQHENLQRIARELDGAIAERAARRVRDLMLRYTGALDAHFSLEDGVFFPALHGLHPERRGDLEALSRAHRSFEAQIERLHGSLEAADLDAFGRGFQVLIADMGRHEAQEERLFRTLAGSEA